MKEPVYTITDWYDGPRRGVANFDGKPYYYECQWYAGIDAGFEAAPGDYLLTPLNAETYQLALEDWAIWERWEAAFAAGKTTQATHPTLPEDQARHAEIEQVLLTRLVTNQHCCRRATGEFHYIGESRSLNGRLYPNSCPSKKRLHVRWERAFEKPSCKMTPKTRFSGLLA